MSYGLTSAGFNVKPASVIEAEISAAVRTIPGLEDAVIDANSAIGQFVSVMTEREALIWGLLLAVYQSAFRETATQVSLDRTMTTVGKARLEEQRSVCEVTLINTTSDNPVLVPAFSQVRQNTTGVIWETLTEVQIPALVNFEGQAVDDLLWQSGTTVRCVFDGTPDLSTLSTGDTITITGATNSSNNITGAAITAINTGSYWVEFLNPARTDNTDDETSSPAEADITDLQSTVNVVTQSLTAGAFLASPGTINAIVTPIAGLDAVTNAGSAQVGRSQETDDQFRVRAQTELVIAQGSTVEAVKRQVRRVAGVTYVAGRTNRTDTTDGNGDLPHSYTFTVVGGDDQDIIDAIGSSVAGGIETNGTVTGTYTDPGDEPQTFRFNRVSVVNPYFIVNITHNSDYPTDGDAQVRAALALLEFEHGQDVLNYQAVAAVSNAQIPGILTIQILQGLTDPPGTSANITIDSDELAVIDPNRVTVNS